MFSGRPPFGCAPPEGWATGATAAVAEGVPLAAGAGALGCSVKHPCVPEGPALRRAPFCTGAVSGVLPLRNGTGSLRTGSLRAGPLRAGPLHAGLLRRASIRVSPVRTAPTPPITPTTGSPPTCGRAEFTPRVAPAAAAAAAAGETVGGPPLPAIGWPPTCRPCIPPYAHVHVHVALSSHTEPSRPRQRPTEE